MINTHIDTSYDQAPVLWLFELIIKNCQFIGAGPKRSLWLPYRPVHVPKSGPLIAIINKHNQLIWS